MFSGILPIPAGEESLDHWLEQARLMFEECDRSDREKRQRIVESLKGPALEIIQAVRLMLALIAMFRYWKVLLEPLSLGKTCILPSGACTNSQEKSCQTS